MRDARPADYVASALGPVLIMALVGSLVFFLADVLYVGEYAARLLWVLFFFVFGAVLVARISMEIDAGRAGVYGVILAGLTWAALYLYVEYPRGSRVAEMSWAINLLLVLVIWWCAHRLTWDSTYQDEKAIPSGAGLLDEAGLSAASPAAEQEQAEQERQRLKKRRRREQDGGLVAWWERYQQYREERKHRPRAHGVWVVYFSLAALPLFGLGQSLIPPEATARRQYAFWLMSVYVASGLGLLLTTAFLGLRRYLRQRKMDMPVAITLTWLSGGATLVVLLLALGAVLPRPYPEYSLLGDVIPLGSPERKASSWAIGDQDPGKDRGRPGAAKEGAKDQTATNQGQSDQKEGGGNQQGESGSGGSKDGKSSGGKQSSQKDGGKGDNKTDQTQEAGEKGKRPDEPTSKDRPGEQQGGQQSPANGSPPPPTVSPPSGEWFRSLAVILKWVVLGLVVLIVGLILLRALLGFLANFTGWARGLLAWLNNFWANLFATSGEKQRQAGPEAKPARQVVQRSFASYADPFRTGTAGVMSPVELVRYSFEALQAWARERKMGRDETETPLEFARRLGDDVPVLEAEARQLADHYAAAAYAPGLLDEACEEDVRQFWQTLGEVADGAARTPATR